MRDVIGLGEAPRRSFSAPPAIRFMAAPLRCLDAMELRRGEQSGAIFDKGRRTFGADVSKSF